MAAAVVVVVVVVVEGGLPPVGGDSLSDRVAAGAGGARWRLLTKVGDSRVARSPSVVCTLSASPPLMPLEGDPPVGVADDLWCVVVVCRSVLGDFQVPPHFACVRALGWM